MSVLDLTGSNANEPDVEDAVPAREIFNAPFAAALGGLTLGVVLFLFVFAVWTEVVAFGFESETSYKIAMSRIEFLDPVFLVILAFFTLTFTAFASLVLSGWVPKRLGTALIGLSLIYPLLSLVMAVLTFLGLIFITDLIYGYLPQTVVGLPFAVHILLIFIVIPLIFGVSVMRNRTLPRYLGSLFVIIPLFSFPVSVLLKLLLIGVYEPMNWFFFSLGLLAWVVYPILAVIALYRRKAAKSAYVVFGLTTLVYAGLLIFSYAAIEAMNIYRALNGN